MPNKKFNIVFDASMNISQVKAAVGEIQKSLSGVSMPQNISTRFAKTFEKLNQEIANFEQQAAKGLNEIGDFKNITKSGQNILKYYQDIQATVRQLGNLSDRELAKLFPADISAKIEKANKAMQEYSASVKKAENDIEKQNKAVAKQIGTVEKLKTELDELKKTKPATDDQFKDIETQIVAAQNALRAYKKEQKSIYEESLAVKQNKEKEFAEKGKNPENLKYSKPWRDATKVVEEYNKKVAESKLKIEQLKQEQKDLISEKELGLKIEEKNQELEIAKKKLFEVRTELEKMRGAGNTEAFSKLVEEIGKIESIDVSKLQTLDDVSQALSTLNTSALEQIKNNMSGIVQSAADAAPAFNNLASNVNTAEASLKQFINRTQEVEGLKQQITYFFGLSNSIELFKRAVHSAYETVKELDEVATQTAVVTDFTVGDMWSQLPEYTKRANELGVAVKGAYESATLYYQQGLDTNEVVAVSSETLKMARIAGMDYADATNYMTAALRGFNMEINETNAQRINDVYSELAAITASDTQEIATAMTKTASIASNAGMEFETTAAFLSQIIETTREAPETAGTALKTVIARFQELKKDPLEIGEVDGEAVDANKIETALKTIDVALRDTNGQFRDLDEVFLEIAKKWNTLDTNTQRYIATMAAGSRQQSRFIAMMSDYSRTMELVGAANNSVGASQQQFEKTLDSLESKLAKLDNAWSEFTMGLANNTAIKLGVDTLTLLINAINDLTGILPDGIDGIAKFGVAALGLKTGGKIFDEFFLNLKGNMGPAEAGMKAFRSTLSGVKEIFTKDTWYIPPFDKTSEDAKKFQKSLKGLSDLQEEYNRIKDSDILSDEFKKLSSEQVKQAQDALIESTSKLGISRETAQTILNSNLSAEQKSIALSHKSTAAKIAEALATGRLNDEEKEQYIQQQLLNAENQRGLVGQLANVAGKIASAAGTTKLGKSLGLATLGEKLLGKAAMSTGAKLAASLGVIGATVAIVSVLFIGVKALYNYIKSQNPEEKFKQLQNATEQAGEAAKEASEKYKDLKENLDALDEKYSSINDLTIGTQAWRDAVQETNQQVLDLVNTYKELAKYVKIEDGVLTLDVDSPEVQNILKGYSDGAIKAQTAHVSTQIAEQEGASVFAYEEYRKKIGLRGEYTEEELRSTIDKALRYYNSLEGIEDTTRSGEALRELGEKITSNSNTISALYSGVFSNAYSGIDGDFSPEILERINNIASPEDIKNLVELEKQRINIGESREKIISDYAAAQGYSSKEGFKIDGNQITWDEQEQPIIVNDEILKQFEATNKITEKLTEGMETVQKNYNSSGLNAYFSGLEGKGFNQKTIEEIQAAGGEEKYAQEAYNELSQELKDFYSSPEKFAEIFAKSYNIAVNDFDRSQARLNEAGLEKINLTGLNENLDYGAVSGLSQNFLEINDRVGKGAAEAIYSELEPIFKSLDNEQANEFASILNSINWSNADEISNLSNNLTGFNTELGLTESEIFNLEQKLINLAEAVRQIDVINLLEQTQALRGLSKDIRDRDVAEGITQEEYDQIAATNQYDMSNFGWAGDRYVLKEGTMNELANSINRIAGELAVEGAINDKTGNEKLRQEALLASGSALDIKNTSLNYSEEEKANAIETLKVTEDLAGAYYTLSKRVKENDKIIGFSNEHLVDLAKASKDSYKNVTALNDALNDNIDAFKDPDGNPDKYAEALQSALPKVQEAFSNSFLDAEFIDENRNLFIQMAQGGEAGQEAFETLGKKSAAILVNELTNGTKDGAAEIERILATEVPDGVEFGVTTTFDGTQIFGAFYEILQDAEKVKAVLNSLGYSVSSEMQYQYEDLDTGAKIWYTEEEAKESRQLLRKTGDFRFKALLDQNNGAEEYSPPSGKGSTSEWENPYDRQYNTLEKINEKLRERENLEKDFQRLQAKGLTTSLGTLNYYKDIYKNLEDQIPLQEKLIEGRKEELADLLKENGAYIKYGSYIEEESRIDIDWDAINAIKKTDTKTGEAVENYISELERITGSIEEAKDEILVIQQNQQDVKQELIDAYLAFEDRVAAAAEARDQKEIDLLKEEFNALSEAESELADAISKSVDEMRQARENEKTEEDIAEKERRLAYLRQDTTGSNALEIKKLEEEIEEQRESYQDALVDQALTNLQEQNEVAAEQRERQIELMQSQLEYNVENGVYNKQVAGLLEKAMEDGVLTKDDDLYNILSEGEGWPKETEESLNEILRELGNQINTANAAQNFKDSNGNGLFDYEDLTKYSNINGGYMQEMINHYRANGGIIDDRIKALNELRTQKINSDKNSSYTAYDLVALEKELSKYKPDDNQGSPAKGIEEKTTTRTYEVVAGDSLSKIAKKELKDANRWPEIASLNGLTPPYTIYPGKKLTIPAFKTGGLADFTGPAWLDGTSTKPELILNARDTENFIKLKDVLSSFLSNAPSTAQKGGDNYFDISIQVDEIANDYDVDQMAERIKQNIYEDSTYRNVNAINFLR